MPTETTRLCECGCGRPTNIAKVTRRGEVKGRPQRFLPGHNAKKGDSNPRWNGGRSTKRSRLTNYVLVSAPDHPRAQRGYVPEHILVVEQAMGKSLRPTAPVHHVDENGENNSNDNLVACDSNKYHKLLHQRQRALDACGHADWRKCNYCKGYDAPENLVIEKRGCVHHRACHAKYEGKQRLVRLGRLHTEECPYYGD